MHPHLKTFAGALLALTLSRSEAPAQSPNSSANPPARVPPQLPMPPVPPSPIEYFRKLIEASPAERGKLLEGKTPEHCRVLTNSIRTYLELRPADRELRLRTMELRYHLTSLLQTAVTNRVQRLASVPEVYRELVRERLAAWDRLPASEQKTLLENGRVIPLGGVMVPPMPPLPPTLSIPLRGFTSNQIHSAEKAIKNWQSYPEAKQQEIVARVERISGLPEPMKGLPPLPLTATEREQMEKTLEKYRALPAAQRSFVLRTFFKQFAELPPDERRQFLRNAESWQAMSADDRERWRHLVNNVPVMPPLPSGFGPPPLPLMPPQPGAAIKVAPAAFLATNTPH